MADKIKIYAAVALVIAALAAFYMMPEYSVLYRTVGLIVAIAVAIAIAAQSEVGRSLISFIRLSTVEMKKVVWPNRKETTQTTLIVGVMVLIIGILLWIFDQFIGWGVRYLTGQG
ncbi:MAG: preprotein translocase subunit SecE [Gammaproteobacteria bacterium]|nr:preprotein translocase subunit SecE [Gammaproteobacteria bacterium]